ncbi:hypothetical protein TcCL_ESM00421 [Trypanosoma cruzi]|uniref:Uncharacterized protein n=1 Tax=Trypanosoma cruzi (strain CL Brener) TaxID=353153 RepID=Q4CYT7_TRYCC|nr:hypothetical protein, conserved [Trypanosoma cruzi]EAN85440.1 hypothetical protein, conserved [Trypanosoma cruzi]RNC61809.1 hypothetical protein TcCL_ESM00421 [Trypanosoma cruzi]|eukprot:XP_807291.1 hypothetical protein [Trypanosoma cruzi strain CL Brener]
MSCIFSELRRSERLLPVEDNASFQRISSWRPLFVDPQEHPALYEHVAFFRSDAEQNSKWMHTVRSARVSTRQVPFITLTGPDSSAKAPVTAGKAPTIVHENHDSEDKLPTHFFQQHVAALAPYECFMCPTLLFSPFRPLFTKRMVPIALKLSLPVQEVFLFLSMMFVYLDVVIAVSVPKPLCFQELTDLLEQRRVQLVESSVNSAGDPHRRAFTTVLNAVIELWKEQREATVSALFPLGTLATSVCLRDIDDKAYRAFVPSASRDTKREDHPFQLPPSAADALVSHFVPTWERILEAMSRDVSVLATLHDYLVRQGAGMTRMRQPVMGNSFASIHALPHNKEELADFVCRLGSSLWTSSNMAKSIVLSKPQLQSVSKIFQKEFFATLLRLRHRGVQELRVRRVTLGDLALTVIQDDGREAEVGRPAGFLVGRTAMGDNKPDSDSGSKGGDGNKKSNLPLWLVAEGGVDVVQTFLEHLIRDTRATTFLPVTLPCRNGDGRGSNVAGVSKEDEKGTPTVEEQQFVLLTRMEEGVLHRIFQSHPNALQLTGCGIRQMLVRRADGQPFLQRVCGAVVAWDIWECYDSEQASKLRRPRRVITADAPFPLPEGIAPSRLNMRAVRGMVQHYWKALILEQGRAAGSKRSEVTSTTLFPIDRAVAFYVLRHHPQYYVRVRGCGIVDVCVQRQMRSASSGRPFHFLDSEATGEESQAVTDDTCEYVPTLAVTHPCGTSTVLSYEDCYSPVTNRLNRPQLLENDAGGTSDLACLPTPPLRKRSFSMMRE